MYIPLCQCMAARFLVNMSIKHKKPKIKDSERKMLPKKTENDSSDIFIIALIVLVAFAGFGLGRLSTVQKESKQAIVFEQSNLFGNTYTSTKSPNTDIVKTGQLVASVNGTKYHFPWCSGAQRIKEENKIWFNNEQEAREAGYTPAANCKGLE